MSGQLPRPASSREVIELTVPAHTSPRGLADPPAGGAWRRKSRPVGSLRAVRTNHPHVVLTYDDGPDPDGTPRILTALDRHDATATFFVLVPRARRHRELLGEIAAAGHEIALHGIDHRRLTQFPPAEVHRRTADGRRELEDLIGTTVRWFRPPYGIQRPRTWLRSVAPG